MTVYCMLCKEKNWINLQNSCDAFQPVIQIRENVICSPYSSFFFFFGGVGWGALLTLEELKILIDLMYLNFPYGELDLNCLGLQSKWIWWFSSASNGLQYECHQLHITVKSDLLSNLEFWNWTEWLKPIFWSQKECRRQLIPVFIQKSLFAEHLLSWLGNIITEIWRNI